MENLHEILRTLYEEMMPLSANMAAVAKYDLDGQPGLFVPNSVEMNALSEIAANMSQTAGAGTSIMLTGSATQQLAGDLGRGVVQGVSGYFAKKIKMPKVTVKAGYQVLLLSKK